jgi:hypothetical protein
LDGYYRGSEKAKDTHALFLSQCLGDQGEAEREWQKTRVQYMSSYAHWGNFAEGTGGGGGIAMRSKGYAFTFDLTPHIWLYPVITHGSTDIYYTKGDANPFGTIGRVAAGNTISLSTKADSETQVRLKSINSYRDIGNFARHTADTQFTLSGSRISDFIVRGTRENPILFNPSASFNIDANSNVDNLRNFEVSGNVANNAQIMNYALNLSRLWRLENLNLTASSTTGVVSSTGVSATTGCSSTTGAVSSTGVSATTGCSSTTGVSKIGVTTAEAGVSIICNSSTCVS